MAVEADPHTLGRDCNRWAVIVGISKYKHSALDLEYADRDAEKLYQLLLMPQGGHFQKEYICKLTNKDATKENITRALRSFLKKPAREDLVIIYFACHGSPDSERPGNVYLLMHDSDPLDIAGTALPMGDIDRALTDTLLSEKVIILADTCHSAAIGSGIRSRAVTENTTLINRYLQEISQARRGTALLTSAEANEVSFEDKKWGGGHGVFTYYLLRGLEGDADENNNGFVAVGELFEYVRENVKKATNHRQHPCIGTNPFDRNMPLAIAFPNAEKQAESSPLTGMPISGMLGSTLPTWSANSERSVFKKHYGMIALLAVLVGGSVLFIGGRDFLGTRKPIVSNDPETFNELDPTVEQIDTSKQIVKEAGVLAERAIAQLQQMSETKNGFTEAGLDEVILIWEKAIALLKRVRAESAGYEKATEALASYESQWQYARALRLGWIAANRAALRYSNTSEEWDAIIGLRKEAIAYLNKVPITETKIYDDARQKISEYESAISTHQEFRLTARYLYARRKGDVAETERVNAESAKVQSSQGWYTVAGLWGDAVAQMKKVMPEDRRYTEAQQKIVEYVKYRDYARARGDLLVERGL